MRVAEINLGRCENGHHFLGPQCPFCSGGVQVSLEYRDGDCIDCGVLCPGYAYGCASPHPLEREQLGRSGRFMLQLVQ